MAEGGRSSRSGERRVYRNGAPTPSRDPKRAAKRGGGKAPSTRGSRSRVRAARPLWQRILLALLVVLAVAAVSFLIGYLIGLKLAIVSFAAF
jgi:hypothetical protein